MNCTACHLSAPLLSLAMAGQRSTPAMVYHGVLCYGYGFVFCYGYGYGHGYGYGYGMVWYVEIVWHST